MTAILISRQLPECEVWAFLKLYRGFFPQDLEDGEVLERVYGEHKTFKRDMRLKSNRDRSKGKGFMSYCTTADKYTFCKPATKKDPNK